MFEESTLNQLAEAINDLITQSKGPWKDAALVFKAEMEKREANLEELYGWLQYIFEGG